MAILALGKDPLIHILSHLPTEDLLIYKLVCKKFREVISKHMLPVRLQTIKKWGLIETQEEIITCMIMFMKQTRIGEKSLIEYRSKDMTWLKVSLQCGSKVKSERALTLFATERVGIEAIPNYKRKRIRCSCYSSFKSTTYTLAITKYTPLDEIDISSPLIKIVEEKGHELWINKVWKDFKSRFNRK